MSRSEAKAYERKQCVRFESYSGVFVVFVGSGGSGWWPASPSVIIGTVMISDHRLLN